MGERLRAELQQGKPFSSLAEEAILNVERTADCFQRELQQTLKPYGITGTQYNTLRILRGAEPHGLACAELGQRLVSSDPDITRLLARLEREAFIARQKDPNDKRVVLTRISAKGLDLLQRLVPVVDDSVRALLGHMREEELNLLVDLLEEARGPLTETPVRKIVPDIPL